MLVQQVSDDLRSRFQSLATQWIEQRGVSSDYDRMILQPAYQQIIGMGPAAIPLLLEELRRKPDHWFWALTAITGNDPISPAHRGNLPRMADDWLHWGEENGFATDNGD